MRKIIKLSVLCIALLVLHGNIQAQTKSNAQLKVNKTATQPHQKTVNTLTNQTLARTMAVAEQKALEKKYNVPVRQYPEIQWDKIAPTAYKKGVIRVKFSPEIVELLEAEATNQENKYITLTESKIDKLNKKFTAKQYKPNLQNLYANYPEEKKFAERHKAWGFHQWYEIKINKKADVKEAVAAFLALDIVEDAVPVYKTEQVEPVEKKKFKTTNALLKNQTGKKPNDTYYDYQWGYKKIEAPKAWDYVTGNPSVIVGVFGGGVQFEHPDLKANIWGNIGPEGRQTSPSDHETHVAGTIAAVNNNNTGVAGCAGGNGDENSGIKIMTLDILGDNISKYEAYVYAADHGVAISQNSWGYASPGVYDPETLRGIDYFNTYGGGDVLDGGITIFSAGNNASDEMHYPSYYAGVIAVAATDKNDKLADFSNYGNWVDIAAPGVDIYSTLNKGAYGSASGTSMACPHVSGIAALILSYAPGKLTNDQLKEILLNNTDTIDYLNPQYSGKMGTGRLNAYKAINAIHASENNKPQAAFTSATQTTIVGKTIDFKDVSTNLPIAWDWTFENGFPETSKSRSPRVIWTEPGTYNVGLVVSNTQGSDTLYYEDYITIKNIHLPSTSSVQVGTKLDGVSGSPLGMSDNNSCSAAIYLGSEIGGSGAIDSLAWFTTIEQFDRTVTIYLKQTTNTELESDIWDNTVEGATMVYAGNITNNAAEWTTIALENEFVYDSASNLMVLVSVSSDSANHSSACRYENTAGYNRHMQWTGITSALISKEGKPDQQRPWIKINFAQHQKVAPNFFSFNPSPYFKQEFDEGSDFPPVNWLNFNSEGHVSKWRHYTNRHSFLSKDNLGFAMSINATGNNWLVTDTIILDEESYSLLWKVGSIRTESYYLNAPYSVLISNTDKEVSSFKTLYSQAQLEGKESWEQHTIDLSDYSGDTIFLSFVHNKGVLCLDDIEIKKKSEINVSIFEGETLKIFDNSTNDPTYWYWETPGATKEEHTWENVNLTYNKEGIYNVSLKSGNTAGSNSKKVLNFVTVKGRTPVSSFSAQGNFTAYRTFGPFIPGTESIDFTDRSIQMPTSWKWDFEGSSEKQSNTQNPQGISYLKEGSFDVSLITTNTTGSDTIIKENYVTVGGTEFVTNFSKTDIETNITRGGNDLHYTGHNDFDKTKKFAEKYTNQFKGEISAIQVHVNTATGEGKHVTFYIWNSENGVPGNILDSSKVSLSELEEQNWNKIEFNKTVEVTGDFFVGYKIDYDEPHNYDIHNFSVYFAKSRDENNTTAFLAESDYYGVDKWKSFASNYQMNTSLAVNPEFTYSCKIPSIDTIYGKKQVESGKEYTYSVEGEQGITYNWNIPDGWTEKYGTDTSITLISGAEGGYISAIPKIACGEGEQYKLLVTVGSEKKYTIEATAGVNGKIEPSGTIELLGGASQSFSFTAEEGYKIKNVEVDGKNQSTAENKYTFTDINANHTLHVEFAPISTSTEHPTMQVNKAIKVYPNPVNNIITIEGITTETICIYNTMGTLIYKSEKNIEQTKQLNINAEHLAAGIYVIKLTKNNKTDCFKVIKN